MVLPDVAYWQFWMFLSWLRPMNTSSLLQTRKGTVTTSTMAMTGRKTLWFSPKHCCLCVATKSFISPAVIEESIQPSEWHTFKGLKAAQQWDRNVAPSTTTPYKPGRPIWWYTRNPCPSSLTQDLEGHGTGRRAGRAVHLSKSPTPCPWRQLKCVGNKKLPRLERHHERSTLELRRRNIIHYPTTSQGQTETCPPFSKPNSFFLIHSGWQTKLACKLMKMGRLRWTLINRHVYFKNEINT